MGINYLVHKPAGMSPTQIKAEKAYESQHRCDFWSANVFTKPCEFLESRGLGAEIPIIQQWLGSPGHEVTRIVKGILIVLLHY